MEVDGQVATKAIIRDYVKNPNGQYVLDDNVREMLVADRFDVHVSTMSGLPFAQAQKEKRTFDLFDRGIVDEREVLEQLEYPNIELVMSRLEERQAAAAQAEAQKGA